MYVDAVQVKRRHDTVHEEKLEEVLKEMMVAEACERDPEQMEWPHVAGGLGPCTALAKHMGTIVTRVL